ncbi:hypothetical protein OTU49_016549, partial [Cherax quadricarinatus]
KKNKTKKLDNDIVCLRKRIAKQNMYLSWLRGLCLSPVNKTNHSCSYYNNQDDNTRSHQSTVSGDQTNTILILPLTQSSINDAPAQPAAQSTKRDQSTMTHISYQEIAYFLRQQDESTMTDYPVTQSFVQPTAQEDQSTMTDYPVTQSFVQPTALKDQSTMTDYPVAQSFVQPTALKDQSTMTDYPVAQSFVQPTAQEDQSFTIYAPVAQSFAQPTAQEDQLIGVYAPVAQLFVQSTPLQYQSFTDDVPVTQSSVQSTTQQDQSAMNHDDLPELDSDDIYNCFN